MKNTLTKALVYMGVMLFGGMVMLQAGYWLNHTKTSPTLCIIWLLAGLALLAYGNFAGIASLTNKNSEGRK